MPDEDKDFCNLFRSDDFCIFEEIHIKVMELQILKYQFIEEIMQISSEKILLSLRDSLHQLKKQKRNNPSG